MPQKIGSFFIESVIARGGMGCVYKAVSTVNFGVVAALKILTRVDRGDGECERQFQNEAALTMLFSEHENSVNVLEYGNCGDFHYLATEYVAGQTLMDYLDEGSPLIELVDILINVTSIIEFIFSKDYLYRDLKPQNIMIGESSELVLIDYGICKSLKDAAVHESEVIDGSAHYLPPERMLAKGEGVHSEIYSLGMLFFHVLSGHTYYNGSNYQDVAEQHVTGEHNEDLFDHMPDVPSLLLDLIDRMTKKETLSRCRTFDEITACLEEVKELLKNEQEESSED
ncbi:MAG: serine/threonine protein kinase [Lentisphaeraceae bacterium]|nr:serine/threonine protein kinase [Lentisphaeraceae bacterium]